jgi:tRNA dimethylallyltransferase
MIWLRLVLTTILNGNLFNIFLLNNNFLKENNLIIIEGPTAVGKTAVGLLLAQKLGCSIISADSRQFYREMKIGTAAPTPDELTLVQHYFVGHKSVTEDYNISCFENDVLSILPHLFKQNPFVLMIGGSGLYIDAICNGIDDMPNTDPVIRQYFNDLYTNEGIEALQNKLYELDPEYYAIVDLKNPVRLKRALEVCIQTKKPYSQLRMNSKKERFFNIVKIGIARDRQELINRIETRVDHMMELGQLEEVNSLIPFRNYNALNTVGYKELFNYIDGNCSIGQAIKDIKTNTRRYAKRQMTWFKRDPQILWHHPDDILLKLDSKDFSIKRDLFPAAE